MFLKFSLLNFLTAKPQAVSLCELARKESLSLNMPVTKTAKRALRSSLRKKMVNSKIISALEISLRKAGKNGKRDDVIKAMSLADIAAKKKVIHKNKAARIKSKLGKKLPKSLPKAKGGKKAKKSSRK